MKKAIGMVCAAGGAMFLMNKMFDLGMQYGTGLVLGAIIYEYPECQDDITAEMKKPFSLKYAAYYIGVLAGQGISDALRMELNKD